MEGGKGGSGLHGTKFVLAGSLYPIVPIYFASSIPLDTPGSVEVLFSACDPGRRIVGDPVVGVGVAVGFGVQL